MKDQKRFIKRKRPVLKIVSILVILTAFISISTIAWRLIDERNRNFSACHIDRIVIIFGNGITEPLLNLGKAS